MALTHDCRRSTSADPTTRPPCDRNAASGCVGLASLLASDSTSAHSFAQSYTLPVPFEMYAWGSAAALILSFVIVGIFATAPERVPRHAAERSVAQSFTDRPWAIRAGRVMTVTLLLLCMLTGFFGTQNLHANFNMTFVWIVFVLAVPYLTIIVGDFYAVLNPWKALVDGTEALTALDFTGRLRYPEWLGYYPAVLFYMAFIWVELFGRLNPRGLATALLVYTAINCAGAWLFGKNRWFRQCEFFGVFLRLIGHMSVWAPPKEGTKGRAATASRLRVPFSGLIGLRADHVSLVLFILFMLSSTAFDGLHATTPWADLFWTGLYPALDRWGASNPGQKYAWSAQVYHVWQWLCMLASHLVYFAMFTAFVAAAKRLTRSSISLMELVMRFVPSLLPIAFVYHLTHYYTLLLAQGPQIVRLVSDPFGWGWNLFGTARDRIDPFTLEVDAIWHTQVALILLGHIVSVYLAHVEALRTFTSPQRATLSQVPMLLLMVLLTTLGLWILSLPLSPMG